MGTLTRGQISKKNFEVGPEVVQPGPEVVQVGPLLVHSNISSTVYALQPNSEIENWSIGMEKLTQSRLLWLLKPQKVLKNESGESS